MKLTRILAKILVFLAIITVSGMPLPRLSAANTSNLKITYDHAHIDMQDAKKTVTTFTGIPDKPVTIYHDDSTFNADSIVVRSEGTVHEFTCTGHPIFTDPENTITADTVVGMSTPRRAEFQGNVKMVSVPKKKEQKDPKETKGGDLRGKLTGEPTTLTADTMSYDYANKYAAAKGNVVVVQKARTIWADEGYYDQKLEKIQLKGNVRVKNAGSEELKELKDADTVTVSLQDNWIDVQAKPGSVITATLEVKDEEKTPEKAPDTGQEKK